MKLLVVCRSSYFVEGAQFVANEKPRGHPANHQCRKKDSYQSIPEPREHLFVERRLEDTLENDGGRVPGCSYRDTYCKKAKGTGRSWSRLQRREASCLTTSDLSPALDAAKAFWKLLVN